MENKPKFCTRFMQPSAAEFSARAEGEELYIEGYFAVFGAKYWLWEEAYETVDAARSRIRQRKMSAPCAITTRRLSSAEYRRERLHSAKMRSGFGAASG